MKTRIILLLSCLILCNACVLKSLQPFYIQSAVSFQKELLGNWSDQKNGTWNIVSCQSKLEEEAKSDNSLSEISEEFKKYSQGYIITYTKKGKEVTFLGMPFKINGKLFMDVTPFEGGLEDENQLLVQHLIRTHSVLKVSIEKDNTIRFNWLDDQRIKELQQAEKIKLQYTINALDDTFLLTASSAELYKFLKKFEATNPDEVWGTSDNVILKPAHAKP